VPCRDPRAALEDILENIARIERFVGGLDAHGFHHDDKTIFAVQYALLAVSDAACRLGDHAAVLCPDTPWHDIRRLGVGLRHGDDRLPRETLWATVQQTLGPLQLAAMIALNRLEGSEPDEPVTRANRRIVVVPFARRWRFGR
jgi:uncharacterized protein with HEPN domain